MILGFALLYAAVLLKHSERKLEGCRPITALAYSATLYTAFIYVSTELLSIGGHLSQGSVFACWLGFDLALAIIVLRMLKANRPSAEMLAKKLSSSYNENRVLYLSFALFAALVIYVALCTVPYNWDSLTYHLTRVALWAEKGGVAHFQTNDTRMLGTPPLKEFVDLHIYVLAGETVSDSLLNLTQTASYLLNILFVVEIADRIGCKRNGKLLAAILFASCPTVLAEAFSTQTDEFATVFVLVFVILVLELVKEHERIRLDRGAFVTMLTLGALIAFIYLAKMSGFFAVAVFTVYLLIAAVRRKKPAKVLLVWCAVTAVSAVMVAAPELLRNIYTYGGIMDPWQGKGQLVLTADPRYLLVNMLKNVGTNISYAIWPRLTALFVRGVYKVGGILGVDVTNELITESPGMAYTLAARTDFSFDTAVNVLLVALFFLCLLLFVIRLIRDRRWRPGYRTAAFLAFTAALCFVKWEPFMARYLVAYFALLAPAIALELERFTFKRVAASDKCCGPQRMGLAAIAAVLSGVLLLGAGLNANMSSVYDSERFDCRAQAYYRINMGEYYNYETLSAALEGQYVEKDRLQYLYVGGLLSLPADTAAHGSLR